MNYLVRDVDVIFNLAGQVSHIDSMQDPYTDLEINCRRPAVLLEACRRYNPTVKVVYAGTRQVYGRPDSLPVSETHLVRPTDVNGINKAAGEYYHLVYNNVFGIRACSLRLTNVYGPRQLLKHNRQGFIAWFIRQAIEDARSRSMATAARSATSSSWTTPPRRSCARGPTTPPTGRCSMSAARADQPARPRRDLLVEVAGTGRFRLVPWPPEKKAIDIGDFYADSSRIGRCSAGAGTTLRDGLASRSRFYARAPAALRGRCAPTSGAVTDPTDPVPRSRARHRRCRRASGDRSRPRARLVRPGAELEAFEAEFAAACGSEPRRRRRERHRCDRPAVARRGRRPRRRGDRAGDDRGVHRAGGDRRWRRTPIVDVEPETLTSIRAPRRLPSRADAGDRPGASVRTGGRHETRASARAAARHALAVVEDCCQAHLATACRHAVGTTTVGGAFSFYPTKNLGPWATPAPSSPTMPQWPIACAVSATADRPSQSRARGGRGQQPARRTAGGRSANASAGLTPAHQAPS
jgi:UDP-glucose 4-epimerase